MMATHKLLSVNFPLFQLLQGADTRDWDFSRNRVHFNMYIKYSNKKQEYIMFELHMFHINEL
jgi:hypothetical protein